MGEKPTRGQGLLEEGSPGATEERNRRMRDLVERVLEVSPSLIYIYDLVQRRNVYANKEVLDFLGYSVEKIQTMGSALMQTILHPEDQALVAHHHAGMIEARDGEVRELEYRMRHAEGRWRWLRSRDLVFARDAEGRGSQILGVCEDITPQRRARDALRQSESRFQHIFHQSPVGSALSSLEGRFLRLNEAFCRMLGYQHDELVGRSFLEVTHPDHRDTDAGYVKQLLAGEIEQYATDKRYLRKDGGVVWANLSLSLVRNRAGSPLYFVIVVVDITDRRRVEEALRQRTEELERYFGNTQDLLCAVDASGRFRELKGPWEATLGRPLGELEGSSVFDLVHPEDLAATRDRLAAMARGERVGDFVNRYRRQDGSYRWIEWPAAAPADGVIYAVARDVTRRRGEEEERRRLEEQLRHSQRLESIGRLAGGVAHDFNNLLTCISGNVSLALLDLRPEDPLHGTFSEIAKAADSAAVLTRQLLAFSRKQLLAPKVIDLNELIAQMSRMLARLIGEDIALRLVPQRRLGRVRVDPGQIEQALVNLVVNARDAMPGGGELRIETQNVTLEAADCQARPPLVPGDFVLLRVSDTGTGMSEEVREHVFEPFFTTKPKDKGTGLGLATVYGIATQAGGTIEVGSQLGTGTTFNIYLPRVQEKAEPLARTGGLSELPGGSETVLLVEDEPLVKDLACRLLGRLGYKVLPFLNGGEALLAARSHPGEIHLLMTDVVMPGMNGRALAVELRGQRPKVRVLFTSGYAEDMIAQHGVLEAGIHFIGKPYTPQALALKIREVLG